MTEILTEIEEVVRLKDEEGLTYDEISDELGFSARTARRRYASRLMDLLEENEAENQEQFPEVEDLNIVVSSNYVPEDKGLIERFRPLIRTGDAMVTMDWHIPLHDPILINRMIVCAEQNDIKTLIIAGDYFHMEAFSSFLPAQPEAALEIERYDGNLIMKTLLRTFDNIDFFIGNHDFRLVKKLGFKKSFEECMQWMLSELTEDEWKKIRISSLDYMYYYPEKTRVTDTVTEFLGQMGRKYYVCHPGNFSSVPLTVARRLAIKHKCSIITGHSHHLALGLATNGKDICIDGGGFFDKHRTEYIQKSTAHHEWVPGWVMFKSGIPHLFSPTIGNDIQFRKDEKNEST